MSFSDPSAEPAQPLEGQGEEASGGGSPWESYLTRIPEDARDVAAEAFREMEANATKKFQEHSEFRKQWEPLQETGIKDLTPEQAAYAVQLFQALEQPDVMKEWWEGYAQQNGLTVQEAKEAEAALDEFGFQDPAQQFEKLLEERLGPLNKQLEQFSNRFEQQDEARRLAEAQDDINKQIAAIESEHGALTDDTKQLLYDRAGRYAEAGAKEAISRAWNDLQRWRNEIEKNALQAKVNQPSPAESGGVPDVAAPEHKRLNDPSVREAAMEFLRNENRA